MADIKKYQDYAASQVDEQAILDKYNAATHAQFAAQREQNRQAENQFYNQMYNTQRTAMDTIRQSNAAAVATGASRGVQAAQELSALLGLQQESVAGATEIAQAHRQTAQEETAAVLENVLNAYQQAATERSQLVQQGIEAASVTAQEQANAVAAIEANAAQDANRINQLSLYENKRTQALADNDREGYEQAMQQINSLNNTPDAPTTTVSYVDETGAPVYTQFDLSAAANGDTTAKDNIYNVLNQTYNLTSSDKNVLDLSKTAQWASIEQSGLDPSDIDTGDEAVKYVYKILNDAKEGKIQPGQIVQLNYRNTTSSTNYVYMYLGGTTFAKVKPQTYYITDDVRNPTYYIKTGNGKTVPYYIPEGYRATYGTQDVSGLSKHFNIVDK